MGEEGTGRRVEGDEGKGSVGSATGTADGDRSRGHPEGLRDAEKLSGERPHDNFNESIK